MTQAGAIKWHKIEAGKYQAEGTTVQVVKSTTAEECWYVLDTATGQRGWDSRTMREARDMATGLITDQNTERTPEMSALSVLRTINEDMMSRGKWSASAELIN